MMELQGSIDVRRYRHEVIMLAARFGAWCAVGIIFALLPSGDHPHQRPTARFTMHTIEQSIDTLNGLLRDEISAVETYDQALLKYPDDPMPALRENRASHQNRVIAIGDRIRLLAGTPATGSGVRGVFASLAESSAAMFGKDAVIQLLEAGEDRGLAKYRKELEENDVNCSSFIAQDLLPAQERTHRRMSDLKHRGATGKSGSSGA